MFIFIDSRGRNTLADSPGRALVDCSKFLTIQPALVHGVLSTPCNKFIYIFKCFFFAITSPIFLQIAKAILKKIDSYSPKITYSKCKAT